MTDHWEYNLLLVMFGPFLAGLISYFIALEAFQWRGLREFTWRHMPRWRHKKTPIYGPVDPYRINGPHARPNRRVGS